MSTSVHKMNTAASPSVRNSLDGSSSSDHEQPKKPVVNLPKLQFGAPVYATCGTGWTSIMENYHMQHVQKAQGYAWMHFQASSFWNKVYLGLAIPSALLSVLIGTAGLGSLSQVVNDPFWYLFLVMFSLNILVSFMNAINGILQPNLTSFQHRQLATDFVQFVGKLQTELMTQADRRIDCNDFTEMTNIQYENLLKNDLAIPSHIVKQFEESVDDHIAKPEMLLDRGLRRDIFKSGATPRTQIIGGCATTYLPPSNPCSASTMYRPPFKSTSASSDTLSNHEVHMSESCPTTTRTQGASRIGPSWMGAYYALKKNKAQREASSSPIRAVSDSALPSPSQGDENV